MYLESYKHLILHHKIPLLLNVSLGDQKAHLAKIRSCTQVMVCRLGQNGWADLLDQATFSVLVWLELLPLKNQSALLAGHGCILLQDLQLSI